MSYEPFLVFTMEQFYHACPSTYLWVTDQCPEAQAPLHSRIASILAAGKQGVRQSFMQNRWLASQADRPSHAKVHGKQPEEQDTLVDMHTTKQIPKQQVYMLTLVSSSHTASASIHDKMA